MGKIKGYKILDREGNLTATLTGTQSRQKLDIFRRRGFKLEAIKEKAK